MHLSDPYRRWLKQLLLALAWFGIAPLVFVAGYYSLTKPTDFDTALSQLRSGARPGDTLAWAIRIGSESLHANDIGWSSNFFGFNVDDSEAQQHRTQVTSGRTLDATYQATYLAKFKSSSLPVVVTAFRDVTPQRQVINSVKVNGLRPMRSYLLFIAVGSVFAVAFFEMVDFFKNRKAHPALPHSV
jgi:hypothetical protein